MKNLIHLASICCLLLIVVTVDASALPIQGTNSLIGVAGPSLADLRRLNLFAGDNRMYNWPGRGRLMDFLEATGGKQLSNKKNKSEEAAYRDMFLGVRG